MTSVVCLGIAVQDMVAVDELPSGGGQDGAGARTISTWAAASRPMPRSTVARARRPKALFTRLGNDRIGDAIETDLVRLGVDMSGNRRQPARIAGFGRPCRIPAASGWWSTMPTPDARGHDLAAAGYRGAPTRCWWIRAGPNGAVVLLQAARAAGSRRSRRRRAMEVERLIELASHVAFSAAGLRRPPGRRTSNEAWRSSPTGPAFLAVTDGDRGRLLAGQDASGRHLPAFPVTAVDTLAAGDVPRRPGPGPGRRAGRSGALRFASATAALKCALIFGGRAGIPDRAAVDRFLEEQGMNISAGRCGAAPVGRRRRPLQDDQQRSTSVRRSEPDRNAAALERRPTRTSAR